jgi:hypothetical protein
MQLVFEWWAWSWYWPAGQTSQARSLVAEGCVVWYWPAEHAVHGAHDVEVWAVSSSWKRPSGHALHTRSEALVGALVCFWPAAHVAHGVHDEVGPSVNCPDAHAEQSETSAWCSA